MREAHPIEAAVGMEYYVSDAEGVGGHLRDADAAFLFTTLGTDQPQVPVQRETIPGETLYRA